MARPYRHLGRTSVVDSRLPLLFPWWYVGNGPLWQGQWDRVRHHYGTKVLSNRDLLPLQGSVKLIGRAWVEGRWTLGAKQRGEAKREEFLPNSELKKGFKRSHHFWPLLFFSPVTHPPSHAPFLPYVPFLLIPPCISPLRSKHFKLRHNHLQSWPQWPRYWHPPIHLGL
jgi:hypothetical protein